MHSKQFAVLIVLVLVSACSPAPDKQDGKPPSTKIPKKELKEKAPGTDKTKTVTKPQVKKKEASKPAPPAPKLSVPGMAKNDVQTLSDRDFMSAILALVNAQRKIGCDCGNRKYKPADPLKWNATLQSIAHDHSVDMAVTKKMSHQGSNGSDVNDRLDEGGYAWRGYGENVAAGQRNIKQVFDSWINSPSHCKNIMNPAMKEIGVAQEDYFWTMVVAAPLRPAM